MPHGEGLAGTEIRLDKTMLRKREGGDEGGVGGAPPEKWIRRKGIKNEVKMK